MNVPPSPNTETFGSQLSWLGAPLVEELCLPAHVNILTNSLDGYRAYWRAIYGVTREAFELIDWDVLRDHGLPDVEARKSAFASMLENMRELCGEGWNDHGSQPTIRPTFGVSLGMLYSMEQAARAGYKITSLASSSVLDPAKHWNQIPRSFEIDSPSLRDNLAAWELGLALTEIYRDEAQFAERACIEFVRRHFRSYSE